jgi:hypothetical protein
MRGRRGAWILVTAPLAVVALGMPSCSSSKGAVGLASGCSLNSDCDSPLVCVFGLCHEACAQQRDCPSGQLCVLAPSGGDHVCDLPGEGSCADGGTCQANETCSTLGTCGSACSASNASNCVTGQACDSNGACIAVGDGGSGDASAGDSAGMGDSTVGDGPISDGPSVEAGPLGYVPSNFGSISVADGGLMVPEGGVSPIGMDGGINYTGAPDVTITGNCTSTCLPEPTIILQSDLSLASLYVMNSLTVNSSAVLTPSDPRPVIFAVLGKVQITGTLNVAANSDQGTAGATTWAGTTTPQGLGAGINGDTTNNPNSGGGGGSYCGVGGKAGAGTGPAASGGSAYGGPTLVPLVAGSAGGYVNPYQWGAAGGAIQISAGTSIQVYGAGIINAGGGGALGGGGSGGAILLEAPTIVIEGAVTANGGGGGAYSNSVSSGNGQNAQASSTAAAGGTLSVGSAQGGTGAAGTTINGADGTAEETGVNQGSGGGGAGFIRLNSSSGSATISGTVSPAVSTMCATQGTL